MSRRDRIRRKNRLEINTNPEPRVTRFTLPAPKMVRVRNTYNDPPLDTISRDLRRIDSGLDMQHLRRLHIQDDIRRNTIDPTGVRYDYQRKYVGRNEQVLLPSDHPICRQRRERKQVLFAKRKAGKGGGQKMPRLPKIILKCHH